MMFSLAIALQMIALSPDTWKQVETVDGWRIARSQKACIAEMQNPIGTFVAFQMDVNGNDWINLTNPSWAALQTGPQIIDIRYKRTQLGGAPIPANKVEATAYRGSNSHGELRLISIQLPRAGFDLLLRNTNKNVRMGFFRGDALLADWTYISNVAYEHLRSCNFSAR